MTLLKNTTYTIELRYKSSCFGDFDSTEELMFDLTQLLQDEFPTDHGYFFEVIGKFINAEQSHQHKLDKDPRYLKENECLETLYIIDDNFAIYYTNYGM